MKNRQAEKEPRRRNDQGNNGKNRTHPAQTLAETAEIILAQNLLVGNLDIFLVKRNIGGDDSGLAFFYLNDLAVINVGKNIIFKNIF